MEKARDDLLASHFKRHSLQLSGISLSDGSHPQRVYTYITLKLTGLEVESRPALGKCEGKRAVSMEVGQGEPWIQLLCVMMW